MLLYNIGKEDEFLTLSFPISCLYWILTSQAQNSKGHRDFQ